MMKYIRQIPLFFFALLLVIGVSYVAAYQTDAWRSRPSSFSSGNNAPDPIDTLNTSARSIKGGDLTVNAFTAAQNTAFYGDTFFSTLIRGVESIGSTSTVLIGSGSIPTNTRISGAFTTLQKLMATNLSNGGNFQCEGSTEMTCLPHICADTKGNVVLCAPSKETDLCSNIDGVQATVPTGYWRNTDGTCDTVVDVCSNIPGAQPSVPVNYIKRNDGTCYVTQSVKVTPSVVVGCSADRPSDWGIFGTNYDGCTNITGSGCGNGNQIRAGGFTMRLTFSEPLKQNMNLNLKVCSLHPGEKDGFFNIDTYPAGYKVCEGPLFNQEHVSGGVGNGGGSNPPPSTSEKATSMVYTAAVGATSIDIPNLYCTRAGAGKDILWSYTSDIITDFTPATNTGSVVTAVSTPTTQDICTNPAGNFDCHGH